MGARPSVAMALTYRFTSENTKIMQKNAEKYHAEKLLISL